MALLAVAALPHVELPAGALGLGAAADESGIDRVVAVVAAVCVSIPP
jgi:hypothetical protein